MKNSERIANVALAGLTLAPLIVKVDPNLNVILTACLTVYVGCYRSVKPTPPSETMSNEHAMRFPFVGSAMLLSLFLLFKFLSKDLVNAVLTCYFFVLGIIALSATLLPAIKRYLPNHWNEDLIIWRFPYFRSLEIEFTRSQIVAAIPGTFFCAWYASQKHWLANNILGLAFCIQGIEMLSLGSFKTGAILLAGLFVYDIFWVFFTPVMVSVAKSFDAPIKLLFPTADSTRPFSMLGLGDIVIPGIFVALALRFDVSRGKESQYFKSAFLGYTVGVVLTIIVMNWFQAAQPALLYIVPSVIGILAAHCIWNGEVKPLMEFDESKTADSSQEGSDAKSSKKILELCKKQYIRLPLKIPSHLTPNPSFWLKIWRLDTPPKAFLMGWKGILKKLPSKSVLARYSLISSTTCNLCNTEEEDTDLILICCDLSWRLWISVLDWCHISTCQPNCYRAWFIQWLNFCPIKSQLDCWMISFFTVSWPIWKARNDLIFKQEEAKFDILVDLVQESILWWF